MRDMQTDNFSFYVNGKVWSDAFQASGGGWWIRITKLSLEI
jgi:hypothetical protein